MAVDYEEGRRLLAARNEAQEKFGDTPRDADMLIVARAEMAFDNWLHAHAEALLNPYPWRPISEATSDMPDNVKYVLAHKYDPEWICLADGPPEDGRWYSDGWHVEPTHFRELKGPGQQ